MKKVTPVSTSSPRGIYSWLCLCVALIVIILGFQFLERVLLMEGPLLAYSVGGVAMSSLVWVLMNTRN